MKRKTNDKISLNIRLNEDFHSKIKFISETEYRSLNNQIEYILQKYIKEYEKDNGEIATEEGYLTG
jgi:hypothetical protein